MNTPRRFTHLAAAAALAAVALTGCAAADNPAAGESTSAAAPAAATERTTPTGAAIDALNALQVKGKAPKTGYEREEKFGQAWKDIDHNGCDSRNDILNRDLTAVEHKPGTHDCKVASGVLADPYTGQQIEFTAGKQTSSAVQIDHVVALSNAWQTGAQQLDQDAREHLANDPLNLLASDGPANMGKSDGDAATWLPSNKGFRCQYVARQVAVKASYHLWVTAPEKDAIARVLDTCPGQALPTAQTAPDVTAAQQGSAETSAPAPKAAAASERVAGEQDGDTDYPNCAAARAAGAAPLRQGEPGYRPALDGDGDGMACDK